MSGGCFIVNLTLLTFGGCSVNLSYHDGLITGRIKLKQIYITKHVQINKELCPLVTRCSLITYLTLTELEYTPVHN